jgi:hypothetical protein
MDASDGERTPKLGPVGMSSDSTQVETHGGVDVHADVESIERLDGVKSPTSASEEKQAQPCVSTVTAAGSSREQSEEKDEELHAGMRAQPTHPRTHVDSYPLPTDSMVTVPLSETGKSVEPRTSTPSVLDRRKSELSRKLSNEFNFGFDDNASSGSGSDFDDDDSFEEAVVVEATAVVARATRAGSIKAMDDTNSPAESAKSSKSSSNTGSNVQLPASVQPAPDPTLPEMERKDTGWPIITVNEDEKPASNTLPSSGVQVSPSSAAAPDVFEPVNGGLTHSVARPDITVDTDVHKSRPSSADVFRQSMPRKGARGSVEFHSRGLDRISTMDMEETLDMIEEDEENDAIRERKDPRAGSSGSDERTPVDWDKLDRTEEHLEEQTATEDDGDEVLLSTSATRKPVLTHIIADGSPACTP